MTDQNGNPIKEELPGTIQRSPEKAQRTFAEAHDSAAQEYGEGERAHRVAISALKHTFEKKGDHWEPKGRKGPSDPRAANPQARENKGESFGGVDVYGSSREELMKRAQDLDVQGRDKMSKEQLAQAIARKQR
ncbi:MAG TPA: ChaB family protein [Trebonia sp.]